ELPQPGWKSLSVNDQSECPEERVVRFLDLGAELFGANLILGWRQRHDLGQPRKKWFQVAEQLDDAVAGPSRCRDESRPPIRSTQKFHGFRDSRGSKTGHYLGVIMRIRGPQFLNRVEGPIAQFLLGWDASRHRVSGRSGLKS